MDTVGWILLTLLIGLIGGLISYRLKLPAGAMLGAMLFVIVFNLISDHAYLPRDSRTVLQIFSGVLLGSRIEKKDLQTLKTIVRPSLVLIVSMVILNL
ncbi:MAG: AbrB family transcriptional regulator, partial [Eubacteriales bacterium]|nr:AbrB family transcriptional regulator [Eubacteriales bacterium]